MHTGARFATADRSREGELAARAVAGLADGGGGARRGRSRLGLDLGDGGGRKRRGYRQREGHTTVERAMVGPC